MIRTTTTKNTAICYVGSGVIIVGGCCWRQGFAYIIGGKHCKIKEREKHIETFVKPLCRAVCCAGFAWCPPEVAGPAVGATVRVGLRTWHVAGAPESLSCSLCQGLQLSLDAGCVAESARLRLAGRLYEQADAPCLCKSM